MKQKKWTITIENYGKHVYMRKLEQKAYSRDDENYNFHKSLCLRQKYTEQNHPNPHVKSLKMHHYSTAWMKEQIKKLNWPFEEAHMTTKNCLRGRASI